jgi:hypothetical protein
METYRLPTVNNRPLTPSDLGVYADIRFDADDSAPTYIGLNLLKGAATSMTDWKVYKFTYSGSNVTRIQLAYGSWDNRASIF